MGALAVTRPGVAKGKRLGNNPLPFWGGHAVPATCPAPYGPYWNVRSFGQGRYVHLGNHVLNFRGYGFRGYPGPRREKLATGHRLVNRFIDFMFRETPGGTIPQPRVHGGLGYLSSCVRGDKVSDISVSKAPPTPEALYLLPERVRGLVLAGVSLVVGTGARSSPL